MGTNDEETTATSLVPVSAKDSVVRAQRIVEKIATNFSIDTDNEFNAIGETVKKLKELNTTLGKELIDVKELPWVVEYETYKKSVTTLRTLIEKTKLPGLANILYRYQQKKAEQQRKLQEEENRRAEAERQRLLKEAAEREAKAREHEEAGKQRFADMQQAKAEELQAEAQYVAPVVVAPISTAKVADLSVQGTHKAEVFDFAALATWCFDHNFTHFLLPNDKALNAEAKNRGGKNPPPGVKFVFVPSTRYQQR